jgi:ABC-type Fe3+ transport system permease subunit
MITALAAGLPLATNDFGDTQTDGIAGPVGLLIIVVLVIATVFLIRNMSKRIKRLPPSFEKTPTDRADDQAKETKQAVDETRTD